MAKQNRFNSIYDKTKKKLFKMYGTVHGVGRTHSKINCGFCPENFKVFHWSLSGSGKKCPNCGAIHFSSGASYPMKDNNPGT